MELVKKIQANVWPVSTLFIFYVLSPIPSVQTTLNIQKHYTTATISNSQLNTFNLFKLLPTQRSYSLIASRYSNREYIKSRFIYPNTIVNSILCLFFSIRWNGGRIRLLYFVFLSFQKTHTQTIFPFPLSIFSPPGNFVWSPEMLRNP